MGANRAACENANAAEKRADLADEETNDLDAEKTRPVYENALCLLGIRQQASIPLIVRGICRRAALFVVVDRDRVDTSAQEKTKGITRGNITLTYHFDIALI